MSLFPSPVESIPPPGGSEFWTRAVASVPVVRTSAVARIIDPVVVAQLDAGGPYAVRGVWYFTAEGGGPSLTFRVTGPTLTNPGGTIPATSLNMIRIEGAGVQNGGNATPSFEPFMTYDAGDQNQTMNTGGPARALARIEIHGTIQVSAPGAFGIEWTSDNALWAITRLAGSYIEYAPLF